MPKEVNLHFYTYAEAAEWFDESDMADYEDKLKEEGIPDDLMPELTEEDFARAKSNRFAKNISKQNKEVALPNSVD